MIRHAWEQVRTQLSFTLEGVISQQLLPVPSGRGRVMAAEILITNPAVRALIRESKSHQIYSQIQTGQRLGMRTMAMSLAELVKTGRLRIEDADRSLSDPTELRNLIRAA